MALMENTLPGAWRSFFAAVICLPAFLALRFFAWSDDGPPGGDFGRPLVAEIIGYACSWLIFALLSQPLAESWGKGAQWPRFLVAWNWTNVVQYILMLSLALPGVLGAPLAVSQVLMLVGLCYAVWIEWFVVRTVLGVDGPRAAALVGLDLAIGLFLGGLVQRLSMG